ncbi:Metallo-hydrolase/oxidoreductase [Calocera viscosa TUFC12733]|uniref:Metallo-hydrolase/oxidoreductase n=1 Tax=Calocera viscosa (strain TUFC12733) TaxID=1330018 RepID=A0A167Q480_CALVF|nr:Metallo-hydrolase/oxidoreductase [Calocera viscosa TUFC12733]
MSAHAHHVDPLSLPFVPIPASTSPDAVVKLTLLHCGELTARRVMFRQRTTLAEMAEPEMGPIFAWVVEKTVEGRTEKYLWDLGLVSDFKKFGPEMAAASEVMASINIPESAQLPALLTNLSPPPATPDTLTGIILSHAHPDHAGTLNEFPASIPVIAGPGTKAWMDSTPDAEKPIPPWVWSHPDFIGEVGDEGAKGKGKGWQKVGSFEAAWDFFGDGSLYLMQAPGHCPGHQVALCRVSTSPDTYVLLGGDTCHSRHIYTPFPTPVARSDIACWAHPAEGPAGSTKGTHTMHVDVAEAYKSIAKLTRMEMEANVMCVLAHEGELTEELGFGIGEMKQGWEKWKESGWKKGKEKGEHPQPKY